MKLRHLIKFSIGPYSRQTAIDHIELCMDKTTLLEPGKVRESVFVVLQDPEPFKLSLREYYGKLNLEELHMSLERDRPFSITYLLRIRRKWKANCLLFSAILNQPTVLAYSVQDPFGEGEGPRIRELVSPRQFERYRAVAKSRRLVFPDVEDFRQYLRVYDLEG